MPTGYTHEIQKGCTFPEFVMACARAFGANVMLRDTPDAPIPEEYQPSTYSQEALERAQNELAAIKALPPEERNARAEAAYRDKVAARNRRMDEAEKTHQQYIGMLKQVGAWKPPTEEHSGLKDFMVDQITKSIEWDCDTSHDTEPEKQTGAEWFASEVERLEWEIAYHTKEHAEEVERTNQRNAWNKALRESLEGYQQEGGAAA